MKLRAQQAYVVHSRNSLCPFLYHTLTLQWPRGSAQLLSTWSPKSQREAVDRTPKATQKQVKHDTDLSFIRHKAKEIDQKHARPTASTITLAERRVFESIKRKLGGDLNPISRPVSASAVEHPAHVRLPIKQSKQHNLLSTNIDDILSLFAPAPGNSSTDTSADASTYPSQYTQAPYNRHASVDPESLDSLTEHQNVYSPQLVRKAGSVALQNVAKAIRATIVSSHEHTRPDVALWQLLESETFPLVALIQQQPFSTDTTASTIQRLHELRISSISTSTLPACLTSLPPDTPLLPLITILYPAATLLALRTFITTMPASPFLLALLPRLRQLGPTSYLLAGNVHFFNALLHIAWEVYSDFNSIESLLRDMRRDSVGFDGATLQVLDCITKDYQTHTRIVDGHKSTEEAVTDRAGGWRTMQANVDGFERIDKYWRGTVERHVARSRAQSIAEKQELED